MQWVKVAPQSKKEEKVVSAPVKALESKRTGSRQLVVRSRKVRRKGAKQRNPNAVPKLPPELEAVTIVPQVIRYVVQASPGSSVTINSAQLQAAQGGIVTVNTTTMTAWASSVKITKIIIWPAASASGTSTTGPEVVWENAGVADLVRDESKIRTLPAGITGSSAPIVSRPPSGTVAGLWHHYDGSQHAVLQFNNLVQGSIIDMHTVYTLSNNLGSVAISIGASLLGAIGWPYLDTSNAKLLPVGRPLIS